MSWVVLVDGNNVLARSGIADPSVSIGSPEVKTELNKAGSFQFDIYPPHPYYDRLIKMKTKIDVVLNDDMIFSGRVLYTQTDLTKKRKVYCEGCLSYLLDTVQESSEFNTKVTQFYDMTVHEFLDRILTRHDKMFITDRLGVLDNFQNSLTSIGIPEGNTDTTERLARALSVYNNETTTDRNVFGVDDTTKLFKLGVVNAEGTADRFKFEIKGHQKSLDMILETLVDTVGGFMRAYKEDPDDPNSWYILEWKDKFGNENMQSIQWGTNLIELQQDESGVETFTRLYPSGKPSSGTGSTDNSTVCLRNPQIYLPIPESNVVYDDDEDPHEEGTDITVPKAANFCEKDGNDYSVSTDEEASRLKEYAIGPDGTIYHYDPEADPPIPRGEGYSVYSGYYMPVYGDPMMLKVDDILNYSQVYTGDFNAIGIQMDTLGLNGTVDISQLPIMTASDFYKYEVEKGCILVALTNQNGDTITTAEADLYVQGLIEQLEPDDKYDQVVKFDEDKRIVHVYLSGSSASTDMDALITKIVTIIGRWHQAMEEHFPNGETPAEAGYYEVQRYGYVPTTDTKVARNKLYYTLSENPTHNEEKYGVIVRAVEFSDVNGVNEEARQQELYRKAVDYIHKNCTDLPEQITLTAIDLKNLDTSIEQMQIGRDIHVKSKPHDIDRHMKCISIDYYLDSPEKNTYVISSKPTGSDAIPKFTEQAETKKKKGSGGSSDATGGTGGSYGGGSSQEQTEEEIAVLKNHVYYTAGDDSGESSTGSYYQLFAKALGMQLDEDGNPIVDIEGNWAWDNVTDASTHRNSIITKLDLLPNSGTLISTINAEYLRIDQSEHPGANPKQLGWYIYDSKVDWYQTEDNEVVSGKEYYNAGHRLIENPETAVYQKVTNTDGAIPSQKGWYVLNGSSYELTEDTQPKEGVTYYDKKSPKELRWRESKSDGNYKKTNDTEMKSSTVYYENVNEGKNTTLLTSKVEVTPGSVLIESIHDAYYEEVTNPPQGANPKTNGWYVKDANNNYRKTNDQEVVSGRTYYTRSTGAEGSIEVVPGDVLIKAINNEESGSSVRIDADRIILNGEAVANSLISEALTVDSIDVAGEASIDNEGYADFAGLTLAGADIEPQVIITGIKVVSTGTNQYKLQAEYADNPGTWVDLPNSTFNRAATPSLSGGWSNGVYTVTSNPASSSPLSTKISNLSGSNNITSNGTYTYKVMYEDENEDDRETGYSSSIVVNVPTGGSPSISLSGASKVSSATPGATYCFSSVTELHSGTKGTYQFKITAGNSEKYYYFVITS